MKRKGRRRIRNTAMLIARLPGEWINSSCPHTSPRSLFESQFTATYNGPNPFASRPTETCLTRSPLYNSRLTAVSWEIRFAATFHAR